MRSRGAFAMQKRNIINKALIILLALLSFFVLASCNLFCMHAETEWKIVSEPTKDAAGEKNEICTSCGELISTEKIPRLVLSETEIFDKLSGSVVKVYGYSYDGESIISQGSGFFIDDGGLFITNAHVVKDAYFLTVKTGVGTEYPVDLISRFDNTSSDYAVCRARISETVPVKFCETAEKNDTVYSLGYPNDADSLQISKGQMLEVNVVSNSVHYYSTNSAIDNGSSGGVLANAYGEVIGITTCLFDDKSYGALKYSDIKAALAEPSADEKSPAEYFHSPNTVLINIQNVASYFEILTPSEPVRKGNTVYFELYLALKKEHRGKAVSVGAPELSFTVDFNTVYSYYDYQNNKKTKTETQKLDFTVHNFKDLKNGVSISFTAIVNTNGINAPGDVFYHFETKFSEADGSLVFYE